MCEQLLGPLKKLTKLRLLLKGAGGPACHEPFLKYCFFKTTNIIPRIPKHVLDLVWFVYFSYEAFEMAPLLQGSLTMRLFELFLLVVITFHGVSTPLTHSVHHPIFCSAAQLQFPIAFKPSLTISRPSATV